MTASVRSVLLGALALGGSASALQLPLQLPLKMPKIQLPWSSPSDDKDRPIGSARPIIESENLQDLISIGSLTKRAEDLYGIAKLSEDEQGHPTRVIGSPGEP